MRRKRLIGICIAVGLMGLTGCENKISNEDAAVILQTDESGDNGKNGSIADTEYHEKEENTENAENGGKEQDSMNNVGQGFKPPAGSHSDKNGNIVDPEGNTFDKNGGWQVPEGGHVDSNGRIVDKDGNVMGGGAKIGSKG